MMRQEFSHEVAIPLPVSEAFPLFTPKGEEAWVPGWSPTYLWPASGETCEEMLFMTGEGLDLTLWTCLQWQPDVWHVRYQRTTPGSRVAFVDVRCRPTTPETTAVRVSYAYVPLSEAGRSFVSSQTPESHAAMVAKWKELIVANVSGAEAGQAST